MSPVPAVSWDDKAVIVRLVAVPVPKLNADAPLATDIVAPFKLSVVAVTTPPMDMPGLDAKVTRQLAELNVMPTLDTAPPKMKHEPEVMTLDPLIEKVEEVNEIEDDDMARKAPVDGVNLEFVSAIITAAAMLPVAETILRPKIEAVVSCRVSGVATPRTKASVEAAQLTVVPMSVMARVAEAPENTWLDVDAIDIVQPFIDTVMALVVPAQLIPVLAHPVVEEHKCCAPVSCVDWYSTR